VHETSYGARPARKAVLIDLGGVLIPDYLPAAAAAWTTRLGLTQQAFLGALFGGSDDQVLTGRVSEPTWWDIVAGRLGAGPGLLAELRQDLASREVWDEALVALLRRLRGHARTAIVSNAWPGTRARMAEAGKLDIADEIVLSCEAGYAKPDPRIYQTALRQLAATPGDALFIDDTPGHVTTAHSLGMTGHLHTSTAGTITRIEDFLYTQPHAITKDLDPQGRVRP
jgi:putative hydrolase of the HAD superfamily